MAWATLCELDELEDGKGKYVEIDGFELAVFKDGDGVYAIDNLCPHAGGSMAAGFVERGCAVCPWHYWAFNLKDGQLHGSPGVTLHTYPIRFHEREGRR